MVRAALLLSALAAVGCASAPAPPDDEVVVRVRVRDDLCPPGGCGPAQPPEPEPFCDAEGPEGLAVLDVDLGYGHGCAALSDGHVRCWGKNFGRQLGIDSGTRSATPVTVRDVEGAVSVGTGRAHGCAVLRDGRAVCWGANAWGQRGSGRRHGGNGREEVARLRRVRQIALGWDHTCARTERGQVFCWGRNQSGQVGHGARELRIAPTRVRGVRASDLAAGFDSSCAVTVEGAVTCWGGITASARPQLVPGLPGPAVSVAVGQGSACARMVDGAVYCWGDGTHGVLGTRVQSASDRAVLIEGLPAVQSLELYGTRACAVDDRGQLWCWGSTEAFERDAGDPVMRGGLGPVAQVGLSTDAEVACARMARGGLCCWGSNLSGLVGTAARPFSSPPVIVDDPVPLEW